MNESEQAIAERLRDAVNDWNRGTDRSTQSKIGVSALGYCSERLRRHLDGQEPSDDISWYKAFLGTAIGDYVEKVQEAHLWPDAIYQSEVEIKLAGDVRTYVVTGHPDVVIPPCDDFPGGAVIDNKAVDGLVWVRRKDTADQSYQFQRNIYAAAAHAMGMLGDGPIEDVMVGNVYMDRSGKEDVPHVQIEPYNPDVLFDAAQWLDEVVYALLQGEEAQKEPPREQCTVCEFFTICRSLDTDAEGKIDHPETLEALSMYQQGLAMEREAKKLKNTAQVRLRDVEGHTPEYVVRWVQVNGGEVSYYRKPYEKLSITKRKK
jgi:hypothetical protein